MWCVLDVILEKLCSKSKQQIGKLLDILMKKKKYHLEGKTQPSIEQSVSLSSSVAYEKLMHKLHNRLIFLRLPDLTWFVQKDITVGLIVPYTGLIHKAQVKRICMEAVGRLRARMNLPFNLQVGNEVICGF